MKEVYPVPAEFEKTARTNEQEYFKRYQKSIEQPDEYWCWLCCNPDVIIFDEPTRGIDVGAKAEIYTLMRNLTAEGYAIIMISSELPEVVGMCDRVAVFSHGVITAVLEGDAISSEEVMRHATASVKKSAVDALSA